MWSDVDDYFAKHDPSNFQDNVLNQVLANNAKHGLPQIDVSLNQGKLLSLYVSVLNAKNVLEIGTLGAYSTIHMARSLKPGGKIDTIEVDPQHARIAQANLKLAKVDHLVDVHVGPALTVLDNQSSTWSKHLFDFVFIDADKGNNPKYVGWALKLTRKGGLIMIDNVARNGAVLNEASVDPSVKGVQELCKMFQNEAKDKVAWTVVQTVGTKGWDGYILAYVK